MYFWNVKRLRNELIENSLNEKNQMMYLMFTMLLYAFSGQFTGSEYSGGFFFAETLAVLGATVAGVLYCYDGNKAGDGKDFIKRFTCISWIITIRLTAVLLAIGIIPILIISIFSSSTDTSNEQGYFGILFLIALEAIYFWRIHTHLKYVSLNSGKV